MLASHRILHKDPSFIIFISQEDDANFELMKKNWGSYIKQFNVLLNYQGLSKGVGYINAWAKVKFLAEKNDIVLVSGSLASYPC